MPEHPVPGASTVAALPGPAQGAERTRTGALAAHTRR
jgi:hypothetical protein